MNIIPLKGCSRANKNHSLRPAAPSALPVAPNPPLEAEIDSRAKARRFCDFPRF